MPYRLMGSGIGFTELNIGGIGAVLFMAWYFLRKATSILKILAAMLVIGFAAAHFKIPA